MGQIISREKINLTWAKEIIFKPVGIQENHAEKLGHRITNETLNL